MYHFTSCQGFEPGFPLKTGLVLFIFSPNKFWGEAFVALSKKGSPYLMQTFTMAHITLGELHIRSFDQPYPQHTQIY
jgi:hypothetical protein